MRRGRRRRRRRRRSLGLDSFDQILIRGTIGPRLRAMFLDPVLVGIRARRRAMFLDPVPLLGELCPHLQPGWGMA